MPRKKDKIANNENGGPQTAQHSLSPAPARAPAENEKIREKKAVKRPVRTPRLTKKQVLEACEGCLGIQANVYRKLGISRRAFFDYRKRWPEIQEAIDKELEHGLDIAEKKLMDLVKAGDFRAITYLLDRKGASRGWNAGKQQIELTSPPVQPIICFHNTPPERSNEDDRDTNRETTA